MSIKHDQKPKKSAFWLENEKLLSFVLLTELVRPKTGLYTVCDRWWIMHPTKGAVFFKKIYPQHYTQREIAEFMVGRSYPWAEVHFIGVAYIPSRHQEVK